MLPTSLIIYSDIRHKQRGQIHKTDYIKDGCYISLAEVTRTYITKYERTYIIEVFYNFSEYQHKIQFAYTF